MIGMPHRGRLNVLANFVGKPVAAIFAEFQGNSTDPDHVDGSGAACAKALRERRFRAPRSLRDVEPCVLLRKVAPNGAAIDEDAP